MNEKILHGGQYFKNPHMEPKNPDEHGNVPYYIQDKNPKMGRDRMFTWCGKFLDWGDSANLMIDINCPECMQSDRYKAWIAKAMFCRMEGNGWYKRDKIWAFNDVNE